MTIKHILEILILYVLTLLFELIELSLFLLSYKREGLFIYYVFI